MSPGGKESRVRMRGTTVSVSGIYGAKRGMAAFTDMMDVRDITLSKMFGVWYRLGFIRPLSLR